jgi:hypothetical protein
VWRFALSGSPVNQPPGGDQPPASPKRRSPRKPRARAATPETAPPPSAQAALKAPAVRAAVAIADAHQLTIKPDLDIGRIWDTLPGATPREVRIPVRRPDDLLVFDLMLDNLQLAPDGPPRLVRVNPNASAALIVEFPPQSFGEQAFLETAPEVQDAEGEAIPPLPSAKVRMAGPSRVVVLMPQSVQSLAYTLAAVLEALRTWPMRLAITATPEYEFGRLFEFDRNWLKVATSSADWAGARTLVTTALVRIGASGIEPAIADAARRLSDRAASGLARGGGERLPETLRQLMQSEVDRLTERFPVLRDQTNREIATASLSLAATESLADETIDLGFDLSAVARVPFLPIVLSPHVPPRNVTALELPYRLILSPITPARWLHADLPVEHRDRTELWHTRMRTAATDLGPDGSGKVRAIWSPDYPLANLSEVVDPPKPFLMSLDAADRQGLVKLTTGFNEQTALSKPYRPRAGREKRLHLSALGGLLDVEGNWLMRPANVDIAEWRHLAALGRDQYVRVVYIGSLACLRHAAALVKVTERKFEALGNAPNQNRVAALRQRYFIIVLERIKQYTGAYHEFHGHNFPFKDIEILTRVTPNLINPGIGASALQPEGTIYGGSILRRMVFWPMISSTQDVMFDIAATDICDRRVTFSMPLLFVGETANNLKATEIKAAYNASNPCKRRASMGGATVCYAPFNPADKGDPRLPTENMLFRAGNLTQHFPLEPNFYPETEAASVGIRAVQRLLSKPDAVVSVTYPDVYKQHRFGESDPTKNTGQVFLQLTSVHGLNFGEGSNDAKSDTLGALASPQMAIQGLSRLMGPVSAKPPADPNDAAQIGAALGKVIDSQFDPTDFFKGAKILGGIDLSTLLTVVNALTGPDVPKMLSRELLDRVEASFEWNTEINQSDPLDLFIPRADPGKPPTTLSMNGRMTTPLANPADTSYEATANLTNFKVNLFGFVILWFETLSFNAKKGQKPDVLVQLREGEDAVQFGGPLEFVNELRNLIPSNGFSDPPSLTVTPSGISASFSINLPTVSVGVFSLSNASLGAGFALPFDSKPAQVKFNFCERQHPFSLTVSFLGGGGFFAIGISTRGVNEVEAALEFGAGVAIDLGVASGSVEIKAGVYFHWLEPIPDKGSIELAGYVRLHGELSVLGIISASLTFNLQIAYLKANGQSVVWGEATLVVEIEVLFFSASVSVRCRREFAGSQSDPKFIDLVPDEDTWRAYCEAFHEEAA